LIQQGWSWQGALTPKQEIDIAVPNSNTVSLVTRNGMGEAKLPLQQKLVQTYFKLLDENDILPAAICFFTQGVRLVVGGSPVLEALRSLETRGVRLILCSACLDYFNLAGQVKMGIVDGMADIIDAQFKAGKVISI
jgi:hypothetical protein